MAGYNTRSTQNSAIHRKYKKWSISVKNVDLSENFEGNNFLEWKSICLARKEGHGSNKQHAEGSGLFHACQKISEKGK